MALAPRRRLSGVPSSSRSRSSIARWSATLSARSAACRLSSRLVEVFDRRFAIDAAKKQARKERRSALLHRGRRFPRYAAQIGRRERVIALQEAGTRSRHPDALEKHVVQAESEI